VNLLKYYQTKYKNLSLQAKNELLQRYGQDTFGPYTPYLLSENNIQLPVFGSAFLIQLDYMINEFNKEKMFRYIEEKFPNSQYFTLIKSRFKEKQIETEQQSNFII